MLYSLKFSNIFPRTQLRVSVQLDIFLSELCHILAIRCDELDYEVVNKTGSKFQKITVGIFF